MWNKIIALAQIYNVDHVALELQFLLSNVDNTCQQVKEIYCVLFVEKKPQKVLVSISECVATLH